MSDEEQDESIDIAPEAQSPEAFDVKTQRGSQLAIDENGNPVFDFTPQDEEEKSWRIIPQIDRKNWKEYSPEILFYGAGVIVPDPKNLWFVNYIRPIYGTDHMQIRAIIYALSNCDYDKPIKMAVLYGLAVGRQEKNRRAILCALKMGLNILPKKGQFLKEVRYSGILEWRPENRRVFNMAIMTLQSYGVITTGSRGICRLFSKDVLLTEFGKNIVRLHKENHLLF